MVFKSIRDRMSAPAPTWLFGTPTFCITKIIPRISRGDGSSLLRSGFGTAVSVAMRKWLWRNCRDGVTGVARGVPIAAFAIMTGVRS